MRVMRSWPETIPERKSYIVDPLPRIVMRDHDYRVLDQVDDDLVLLEWDIAVGQEDLQRFLAHANGHRDHVIVAPYMLYEQHSGRRTEAKQAHRILYGTPGAELSRFVTEQDHYAHLFGFGMIYLPRFLVRRFLAGVDGHFSDVSFSSWHYRNAERNHATVLWDVHVTHVHYRIDLIAEESTR